MSAYFLMTIAGRLLNIPILRLLPPIVAYRMYAAIAFGLLLVIFAVPSLSVFVVLFPLVGLVSGCLFPTNLALASSWLIGEFRAFIARSTVVGGVSLLLFPLILGSLAQITNIEFAFAAVSIGSLLVVMALLTVLRSQKT
jgi:fucose permease